VAENLELNQGSALRLGRGNQLTNLVNTNGTIGMNASQTTADPQRFFRARLDPRCSLAGSH